LLEAAIVRQLDPLRKRRTSRLLKARRTRYRTIGMSFIDSRPPERRQSPESEPDDSMTA
jgi:hypothetical protein